MQFAAGFESIEIHAGRESARIEPRAMQAGFAEPFVDDADPAAQGVVYAQPYRGRFLLRGGRS